MFADEGMYTIGETNVPPKDEDQEFLSECILRAKEDYPNMIPGPMDPLHWRRLDDVQKDFSRPVTNFWGKVI